jgi:hypothetical protein
MIEDKAFRTFIRINTLFKIERLKVALHKTLISSVMTYACSTRELAADTQRLQNKVLRTIGNFPKCTPVGDLHTSFYLPYVYDYITK